MTAEDSRPALRAIMRHFLIDQGFLPTDGQATATALTGGVSSELWRVELAHRTICVKGALARLKVDAEWRAPVSRTGVEHDWLQFAAEVCPGQVPEVLAYDASAGLIAMQYLPPEHYPVWKTELLAGDVDASAARQVGDLVGRLHAAGAADPALAKRFATDDNFHDLRIAPYLHATARAHPDLAEHITALAERIALTRLTVIHGDVSPKNILLGPHGPVLLDAECAWYGDPAFDVAFCLNHLLLKSVLLSHNAAGFRDAAKALFDGYTRHITWESVAALDARAAALLPALALARIDGASPVEYLDVAAQTSIRKLARARILDPAPTTSAAVDGWLVALGEVSDQCCDGPAVGGGGFDRTC
ncbi:aminoglycoside phosphotransferase family protein [Nocardia beijingensis]|uniref:phosphotransferase family protein n=1 Tax=Nocardia beijingensis TaxID=95162 RepID=UPI0033292CFC